MAANPHTIIVANPLPILRTATLHSGEYGVDNGHGPQVQAAGNDPKQKDRTSEMNEQHTDTPTGAADAKPIDEASLGRQPHAQASTGLDTKIVNLFSYFFAPVSGLIIYFTSKDREVRFHAAQSILIWISTFVVVIGLQILIILQHAFFNSAFASLATTIGCVIFALCFTVLVVVTVVKGYKQQHFKFPLIGNIAERWAAK
jgi:uncharacterized membrane protein